MRFFKIIYKNINKITAIHRMGVIEMTREYSIENIFLLYLARAISNTRYPIGFTSSRHKNKKMFSNNSNPYVLKQMARVFSKIIFLENDMVAVCDMPVLEAKYYLNIIAAFLSGRHGIIGPLNFISEEIDIGPALIWGNIQIIKINKGVVDLKELKIFFGKFSVSKMQAAEIKKLLAGTVIAETIYKQIEGVIQKV